MTQMIRLIAGLGNPGSEYQNTRHNAGAIFVEKLAREHGQTLRPEKKFHGLYGKISIDGNEIHLLIPTTYMNLSGQSLQAISNFYKITPEQILVVHDELDIPSGSVKLKLNGGHGGNNGLRDIIAKFGGNKEFKRLRIGIGHPGHSTKVTGHVLGKLSKSEAEAMDQLGDEISRYLPEIIRGDYSTAMNHLHSI